MDGVTYNALMLSLIERGLRFKSAAGVEGRARGRLPTRDVKNQIARVDFSNAGLFDFVNE